jgi:hypothetical protein
VAALRRQRRQLPEHRRRQQQPLHAQRAPTSAGPSAWSSPRPTTPGPRRPPPRADRDQGLLGAGQHHAAGALGPRRHAGPHADRDPGTWSVPGRRPTPTSGSAATPSGANCVDIPGATDDTYTPTAADVGHTLRAEITATNDAGATTTTTPPSAPCGAASVPTTSPASPAA